MEGYLKWQIWQATALINDVWDGASGGADAIGKSAIHDYIVKNWDELEKIMNTPPGQEPKNAK